MTIADEMNAITNPIAMFVVCADVRSWRAFQRLLANAAVSVGMARKNENSVATARSRPSASPPMIVAPDRDTPGMIAMAWQTPTPNAFETGVLSTWWTVGRV